MAGPPPGWVFDDEWVHEDCRVLQGPGNGEAQGVDQGSLQFSHILTCKDCGERVVFEASDSDILVK